MASPRSNCDNAAVKDYAFDPEGILNSPDSRGHKALSQRSARSHKKMSSRQKTAPTFGVESFDN